MRPPPVFELRDQGEDSFSSQLWGKETAEWFNLTVQLRSPHMVTAKGTRLHQKAATDLQHDRKLITAKFLGFGFPLNQGNSISTPRGGWQCCSTQNWDLGNRVCSSRNWCSALCLLAVFISFTWLGLRWLERDYCWFSQVQKRKPKQHSLEGIYIMPLVPPVYMVETVEYNDAQVKSYYLLLLHK